VLPFGNAFPDYTGRICTEEFILRRKVRVENLEQPMHVFPYRIRIRNSVREIPSHIK
jgi:hypothetical protein